MRVMVYSMLLLKYFGAFLMLKNTVHLLKATVRHETQRGEPSPSERLG